MVIFNALQTSLSGGIGRYSYELSRTIYLSNLIPIKIVIRDEDRDMFNFAREEDLIVAQAIRNSKDRNYYEQFVLPKLIKTEYKGWVVHYPDSMAPLFLKNKTVITVHDLSFYTRAKDFTLKSSLWKKFITSRSVNKTDKVICITNFAKGEVLRYFNNSKEKLEVVHNGFNNFSQTSIEDMKIRNEIKHYTGEPYFLTVSTISPRKNMDGLITAFNEIKDRVSHNLIIAGANGWLYSQVFALVEKLNLKNRVFFTGKINDEELKFLYKKASAFVYPSFYEGFGLPPLEAMSFGIPCAVSNAASLPEVVGNAALYFNPEDTSDISRQLYTLATEKDITSKLMEEGYIRIKEFSWQRCAVETISVYNKLLTSE